MSADIDIFMMLDPSYYAAEGYGTLLDRVRRVLLETYTKSPKISRSGQAVTITFTDFVVDVVPAFYRTGGGYLIPSTIEKGWISTNPKVHETFISDANAAHDGDLVPLIKMMKGWNRAGSSTLRSFYLELSSREGASRRDYQQFFKRLPIRLRQGTRCCEVQDTDPAGLGSEVSGLSSGTVAQAVSRMETASARAQRAEALAAGGKVADAVTEWRKVFGDYFPPYG